MDTNGLRIFPPYKPDPYRESQGEIPERKNKYWNIEVFATGKTYKEALENLDINVGKVKEEHAYYMRNKAPSSPE